MFKALDERIEARRCLCLRLGAPKGAGTCHGLGFRVWGLGVYGFRV